MLFSEANQAAANTLLRIMSNSKEIVNGKTVPAENFKMFIRDYKQWFNPLEVPAVKKICNKKGKPVVIYVNRLRAIQFIKTLYGFLDREELITTLGEECRK